MSTHLQFFDTHCHVHESEYALPIAEVEERAVRAGVDFLLCVGTTVDTSKQAVAFAAAHPNCWASIGLHPHDAKGGQAEFARLASLLTLPVRHSLERGNPGNNGFHDSLDSPIQGNDEKGAGIETSPIVAIGECGLDYFYSHSSKQDQEKALRFQIELALTHNLPHIFHVRDAFDDFWPIFDSYPNLRGVLHSFTDSRKNLDKALERGVYIGVNGIVTFTKNAWQLDVARAIPLERLLLETDAPFLTPAPFRGKVNEPANVRVIATFLSELRQEPLAKIATASTRNALQLFIKQTGKT